MPFARSTLSQLRQAVRADLQARLPGSNPYVRRSVLGVLADVLAAAENREFGYLDWIARMAVPFTAEDEFLLAWAALKGLAQKPAVAAGSVASEPGQVTFVGTAGAVIPGGAGLSRDDGEAYAVTVGGTIPGGGSLTLTVTATVAAAAGNCDAGTLLSLASPIAGINDTATVVSMTGGADLEAIDALRTRMLQAFANSPAGGDAADYVTWALAVAGVTRAWSAPLLKGVGTVGVYFMMDAVEAAFAGIPQGTNGVATNEARDTPATGDQLVVANALYPSRPVTALVYAMAPVPAALNLTLAEVTSDPTVRAGIAAALAATLIREASPGGAYTADPVNRPTGVLRLSHLDDAISAVPGLDHYVLASPIADITVAAGQISTPGTITYL